MLVKSLIRFCWWPSRSIRRSFWPWCRHQGSKRRRSRCPRIQCPQIYRYKQEVLLSHPERKKEKVFVREVWHILRAWQKSECCFPADHSWKCVFVFLQNCWNKNLFKAAILKWLWIMWMGLLVLMNQERVITWLCSFPSIFFF